jgi:hypothetical protein
MNLSLLLFLVGILGFILNRKNIISNVNSRIQSLRENKSNFKNIIRNIIQLVFLIVFGYKMINAFYNEYIILYLFSFFMSAFITNYILNNYTYSNNKYIRSLERFSIWGVIFFLLIVISAWFGAFVYAMGNELPHDGESTSHQSVDNKDNSQESSNESWNLNKLEFSHTIDPTTGKSSYKISLNFTDETLDKAIESGLPLINTTVNQILLYLGVASAAGAAAVATIKRTVGQPLGGRLILVSTLSGATGAATKLAIAGASSIVNRDQEKEIFIKTIEDSKFNVPNTGNPPSPDGNFGISSVLEGYDNLNPLIGDSPLEILIGCIFYLSVLIFLLNSILLYYVFTRHILKSNL